MDDDRFAEEMRDADFFDNPVPVEFAATPVVECAVSPGYLTDEDDDEGDEHSVIRLILGFEDGQSMSFLLVPEMAEWLAGQLFAHTMEEPF